MSPPSMCSRPVSRLEDTETPALVLRLSTSSPAIVYRCNDHSCEMFYLRQGDWQQVRFVSGAVGQ